jgi:PilZ domain
MSAQRRQMDLVHEDRRDDRRYPIELEMRYKLVTRNRAPLQGTGRTLNISSGGVLFDGDRSLPAGAFVELSIHWPIMLQQSCPLTLCIVGRVVRCHENQAAVKLNRYEFHTRTTRTMIEGMPVPPPGKLYHA